MELFSVLSGKGPILFFPQSRPRNKVKNHSQRQYEILKLNQKTKNVATSLLETNRTSETIKSSINGRNLNLLHSYYKNIIAPSISSLLCFKRGSSQGLAGKGTGISVFSHEQGVLISEKWQFLSFWQKPARILEKNRVQDSKCRNPNCFPDFVLVLLCFLSCIFAISFRS